MKKGGGFVVGVLFAVAVIAMGFWLFFTKGGIAMQFIWKYKIPKENRKSVREEFKRMTMDEAKYTLEHGAG
jgi:hypothetical protein